MLGLDAGTTFEGRDLSAHLREPIALDPAHPVHLFRRTFDAGEMDGIHVEGPQYGIRVNRWKYIVGPREYRSELYDLDADPRERTNLAPDEPARVDELAARIEAFRAARTARPETPMLTEDEQRALEALGYAEPPPAPGDRD